MQIDFITVFFFLNDADCMNMSLFYLLYCSVWKVTKSLFDVLQPIHFENETDTVFLKFLQSFLMMHVFFHHN